MKKEHDRGYERAVWLKGLAGTRRGTFLKLMVYLKPYWVYIALALVLSAAQVAGTLLAPIVTGRAIDYIVETGNVDFAGVYKNLIFLGVCIVTVVVSQWLVTFFTSHAGHSVVKDLRIALSAKLNHLPFRYLDTTSIGDIMSRVTQDTELLSEGIIQGFATMFSGIILVTGTLVVMFIINYIIAIIVTVITPLSIFFAFFISKKTHKRFSEQMRERGNLSGLIEEMLSGQLMVQAHCYEDRARARFDEINKKIQFSGTKATFYSSIPNPFARLVNMLVYSAAAIVGSLIVLGTGGVFSVGSLTTILFFANQFARPFNEITSVATEFQSAIVAARRVFDILDETEETPDDNLANIPTAEGNVRFRDVAFSYADAPFITGFNLTAQKGQRIGIVGRTGSGKTTVINLLMRFYDVSEGGVTLDNTDIRDCTRLSLRQNYGMVLQDSWLKSGTIRQNIAYGKPGASMDEIVAAAKSANIHGFIMKLEKGYETLIGESGDSLSSGQMQLVCIARVMLAPPPVLILDEATSNIDTRTEHIIQDAFMTLMRGRTSFIIAHRFSTVKNADTIIVMDGGKIIEQGNHAALLAQNGVYNEMYSSQYETEL